jgi:hypothetical protein
MLGIPAWSTQRQKHQTPKGLPLHMPIRKDQQFALNIAADSPFAVSGWEWSSRIACGFDARSDTRKEGP